MKFLIIIYFFIFSFSVYSAELLDIKKNEFEDEINITFIFDKKTNYNIEEKTKSIHYEIEINEIKIKNQEKINKLEKILENKFIKKNCVNIANKKNKLTIELILEIGVELKVNQKEVNNQIYLNLNLKNVINKEKIFLGEKKIKELKESEIKIIVIDAGHGGSDPGAVNEIYDIKEKDLTLDYALCLYEIFMNDINYFPILTRDTDYYLPLWERNRIAQKNQADLFISIHCNYSSKADYRGTEVYYYLEDNNDTKAIEIANVENKVYYENEDKYSVFFKSESEELNLIFWELKKAHIIKESANLTSNILNELRNIKEINVINGLPYAKFVVLRNLVVPSVLLEVGFLTNREDLKLILNNDFKKKYCEAVYQGVKKFYGNNKNK
ncbi:MAG TPA: N-acetylmuramoyl-L-alanine amidase [bacterium]|nr:N-acetylmuramoyl-L-alanine amidase [bacterium]HOL48621.1 N-acetylmuramoyl-L-alanine amidase [bacterium]HPQ19037.1 N-acetylmuramoyl-L-alanine amidase [bacterium]